jgi:PHD/YefM family antitoxin component YafN of YafNO toxin-antitoxin module
MNEISVTDLRKRISEVSNLGSPLFVLRRNKYVAVVLSIEDYQDFVLFKAHALAERSKKEECDA